MDPDGLEPVYLEFADALELYAAIVGGTTGHAALNFATVRVLRARSVSGLSETECQALEPAGVVSIADLQERLAAGTFEQVSWDRAGNGPRRWRES